MAKKNMSFEEVLNSEYRHLVEGIEHGSSDPEVLQWYVDQLLEKTGYVYVLSESQKAGLLPAFNQPKKHYSRALKKWVTIPLAKT